VRRKQKFLKAVLIALFVAPVASSCQTSNKNKGSTTKSVGVPVGQFRGYQRINALIRSRLLEPGGLGRSFDLGGTFLGAYSSDRYPSELALLMGSYTDASGKQSYVNGEPNAVSMTLWDTALTGFAGMMSGYCSDAPGAGALIQPPLNVRGAQALRSVCAAWPNGVTDAQLHELWSWVMLFDAPESAEADWKAGILDPASPIRQLPAKDGVAAIMRTIFLNPWFLLES
jgi:hypothetical protein